MAKATKTVEQDLDEVRERLARTDAVVQSIKRIAGDMALDQERMDFLEKTKLVKCPDGSTLREWVDCQMRKEQAV